MKKIALKIIFYGKYVRYIFYRSIGYVGAYIKNNVPFLFTRLKPLFPDFKPDSVFLLKLQRKQLIERLNGRFHRTRIKKYEKKGFIFRKKLLSIADEVVVCGNPENVFFIPPRIMSAPVDSELFGCWPKGSFQLERPFISRVAKAELVSEYAWGFTKERTFIFETGIFFWEGFVFPYRNYEKELEYLDIPVTTTYDHTVVSLVNKYSFGNYYHWVIERLTLLEAVEVYEREKGIRPKLLVHAGILSWQKELLAMLGYIESDYLYWHGGRVKVQNLLVPSVRRYQESERTPVDSLSPQACKWLRAKAFNALEKRIARKVFSKRIYISRYKDSFRRLLNEDQFVELLNTFGFERYYLVGMSLQDQIDLFAGAEIIIAQHGAALTNLLWASKGTRVLEIQNESYFEHSHVYYQISNALELEYMTVVLENKNDDFDSLVNLNEFSKVLREII